MALKLGGHRGSGCTDHAHYQSLRNIAALPVENTINSVHAAFDNGADYVEIDAVSAADGTIFCLHNVVPRDHFFGPIIPGDNLNNLSFAQIQEHPTGRQQNGTIAPLTDMLTIIQQIDPHTLPWSVNIEIKGVQGSGQPVESGDFIRHIVLAIEAANFPVERVLFSSFSLANILHMSQLLPQARYGMLFAEQKDEEKPIYTDHQDDPHYYYLQFTPSRLHDVMQEWKTHAHPEARLEYTHPEIRTITPEMLTAVKQYGVGINSWSLRETFNEDRATLYRQVIGECMEQDVPMTVITDYLPEIKKLGL